MMNYAILRPIESLICPICNGEDIYRYLHRKHQPFSIFLIENNNIPEIDLTLNFCSSCMTVFSESGLKDKQYDVFSNRLYQQYTLLDENLRPFPSRDDYYIDSLEFLSGSIDIQKICNVLEIGSNRGDFLYLLKEKYPHLNVVGVEPSHLPFYGVKTVNQRFSHSLFNYQFDLIIVRHVIEHITDPNSFLNEINGCLQPNGYIFIEVPNFYIDLMQKKETFIPEHIFYFTKDNLSILLTNAGLQIDSCDDHNPNGMYAIARKDDVNAHKPLQYPYAKFDEMRLLLSDFTQAMQSTISSINRYLNDGYTLAFYGFGNVFLSVYAHIINHISEKKLDGNCILLDDTPKKAGMRFKQMKVVSSEAINECSFDKLAVIICTMNRQHQLEMANRIRININSDHIIFFPWSECHTQSACRSVP